MARASASFLQPKAWGSVMDFIDRTQGMSCYMLITICFFPNRLSMYGYVCVLYLDMYNMKIDNAVDLK